MTSTAKEPTPPDNNIWAGSSAPLRVHLGRRLRALRVDAGKRQQDVAAAANDLSLPWVRATVAQLEAGTRSLSVEEFLLLSFVLARATDRPVTLRDLLGGGGAEQPDWIELTEEGGRVLSQRIIKELVEGEATPGTLGMDVRATRQTADYVTRVFDRIRPASDAWWPTQGDFDVLARAAAAADGDTERKAAARLAVTPEEVAILAERTWGMSLSDKRDSLVDERIPADAPPRTRQAYRALTTRRLLKELFEAMAYYEQSNQLDGEIGTQLDEERTGGAR